jgi:7-carboxy-7-deazaguanine synthase
MTALPVNEIFETVQGEAHYTGMPSIFIRLQGCDVGCPWCDTKHTWERLPENAVPLGEVIGDAKTKDSPTYAVVEPKDLVDVCDLFFKPMHIVITGGEPCDHDLNELTALLSSHGYSVQIETSGTSEVRCAPETWVTLSPKIGMPGGKTVRHDAVDRADEIKIPVGKRSDVEQVTAILLRRADIDVWLQPLSQSEKATKLCIDLASQNDGWRVSFQVHKFVGLR